jgi:phosphinothricin acetyltransferase
MIRQATTDDAAQICEIYNHYVLETRITFEEQPVALDEMIQRIQAALQRLPWLVVEEDRRLIGYCYASKWKGRCAYRYSVESTVYLRPDAVGKGVGSRLYDALLAELRQLQFHTVIGGIALPNPASVALHEKFGFARVVELGSLVRGQALVGVEVAVKCAPNNGGCEWNRTEDNTTVLSNVVERSGPLRP